MTIHLDNWDPSDSHTLEITIPLQDFDDLDEAKVQAVIQVRRLRTELGLSSVKATVRQAGQFEPVFEVECTETTTVLRDSEGRVLERKESA